jgi:hypothetical protein
MCGSGTGMNCAVGVAVYREGLPTAQLKICQPWPWNSRDLQVDASWAHGLFLRGGLETATGLRESATLRALPC